MLELVSIYSPGGVAHRNWKPGEFKIRVLDNTVGTCVRALVNFFVTTGAVKQEIDQSPEDARYTVEGNKVEKTPEQVRFTVLKP